MSPALRGKADGYSTALSPPYTTENLIGVTFPMLKPRQFLGIAGAIPRLRGQSMLFSRSLARLFPGYPSRWGVDTNDWCLKIDRDNN